MNPDARVGRTRLSAAAEVGVAFDFCVDLFIAWLDQDHHNLRPKAAGNSVRPTQPGDSRLRSLRSLLLPHPRRCFTRSAACPRMVYVSFWCLSASKVTRAGRRYQAGAGHSESGISCSPVSPRGFFSTGLRRPTLKDDGKKFLAIIGDAAIGDVVALPTGRRIIGIEFGQADRGNVTGQAVNHQPSAALPHPTRRRSSLAGQAIVHRNARRTTNTRSVTSCTVPTVNSLARLSTYKVRTFKSRHLLSFSPAHHLMAVHFPRLTACALVAPEWRIQQGIEEDPERCMRTRTSTWWKPGVLGK